MPSSTSAAVPSGDAWCSAILRYVDSLGPQAGVEAGPKAPPMFNSNTRRCRRLQIPRGRGLADQIAQFLDLIRRPMALAGGAEELYRVWKVCSGFRFVCWKRRRTWRQPARGAAGARVAAGRGYGRSSVGAELAARQDRGVDGVGLLGRASVAAARAIGIAAECRRRDRLRCPASAPISAGANMPREPACPGDAAGGHRGVGAHRRSAGFVRHVPDRIRSGSAAIASAYASPVTAAAALFLPPCRSAKEMRGEQHVSGRVPRPADQG